MSDTIIFDQLGFVKRGVDAGVTPEVAEWLATEQTHLLENNLATKADIEGLRKDTQIAIAKLGAKLIRWLFGALIAQGGLVVTLVKLL